ncbi:hypothetical protein ABLE91_24805 [Aquabacter sp. CN5-332]|uniref:hypothetical protein n=1 Tax=Aquabacter sp. CN5-332 TaxID=3156608 RepID=UPI0032B3E215
MPWLLVCGIGLAFGFVFRVPAVLAMGTLLFAAAVGAERLQGAGWADAALSGFILLALFEGAYLAGVLLAAGLTRMKARRSRGGRH